MSRPEEVDLRALAEEIVGSLFLNGFGEHADRLVLVSDTLPARDLAAWWTPGGAVDAVERALRGRLHPPRIVARIAPWPDFVGWPIPEGATIRHPTGEEGRVVFLPGESNPGDQWRVDYGDSRYESGMARLCLQIGDEGMAVVVREP